MVDSERTVDGFPRFGSGGDAGCIVSRRDTAKKGDVEYVSGEGSGGVDTRPMAQSVQTRAGQRVRPAVVECQSEISQRHSRQWVLYSQLGYRTGGRDQGRVDGDRLRGRGLGSRHWKGEQPQQHSGAKET